MQLLGAPGLGIHQAVVIIDFIKRLMVDYNHRIRAAYPKMYSQDLINNLFRHPYTKIDFLKRDLNISRLTAAKYLDTLAEDGFLAKEKIWRTNYYVNLPLFNLLKGEAQPAEPAPPIVTRRPDQA